MKRSRVIGTTPDAIRAAERELGRPLPPSFAQWLLLNNGKSLDALAVLPVYDARDPRKTWNSIVRYFHERWPPYEDMDDASHLLPFALLEGDHYCFDYRRVGHAGEPVVVLWSHETCETRQVADSFAAFVALPELPE
jgi:cell wall assembly regulator SMI1